MTIIIGFSRPKNKFFPIFSWAIRAIDKTEYSHVYVRWYSEQAETWVTYEAAGNSLRFVGNKVFEHNIHTVKEYAITLTPECKKNLLRFCLDNAMVPYGKKQIFGILLAKIFRLKENPFKDGSDTMVCSEAIARLLVATKKVTFNKSLDLLDPKDLDQKLYEIRHELT